MPTIAVKKNLLFKQLETSYTDEQFDELCFQFGIELDEITSEKKIAAKESKTAGEYKGTDEIIYKIDIPANRYDLLCLEGLVLALRIFTSKSTPPNFIIKPSELSFKVDIKLASTWPVLMGAIVKNIKFNHDIFNSFLELQDKIHQNIGRKKTMVYLEAFDLQKLIKNGLEKTISSMSPENCDLSIETNDVLVKISATDRQKATIALDNVVAMLMIAKGSFEAESILIKYDDGSEFVYPKMDYHRELIDPEYINKGLGIDIKPDEIANLMSRMSLKANFSPASNQIEVFIPPTRHDIIHKCDIMEDVGIAYGYDNIEVTLPKRQTIGTQIPLNKLTDQLRHEIARCGFTEALNFALCSEAEVSDMLRRPKEDNAVKLQNPKTIEFQIARTCLLSGLLKTLNSNKMMPLPMKLYEISDIVLLDDKFDVGARNERHIAAIYCGKQSSGFETIHGLLDRIMQVLDVPYIGDKLDKKNLNDGYYIEGCSDEAYLPGRCAAIIYRQKRIGLMGTLHPQVLLNFELNYPTSAIEIDMEKFTFATGTTN